MSHKFRPIQVHCAYFLNLFFRRSIYELFNYTNRFNMVD